MCHQSMVTGPADDGDAALDGAPPLVGALLAVGVAPPPVHAAMAIAVMASQAANLRWTMCRPPWSDNQSGRLFRPLSRVGFQSPPWNPPPPGNSRSVSPVAPPVSGLPAPVRTDRSPPRVQQGREAGPARARRHRT